MPGKFLKGFPRRKSSGNVLDEVQNEHNNNRDSTSSFRVLARPDSQSRSLESASGSGSTGRSALRPMADKSRPQPPPKSSFELDNDDLFSVAQKNAPNRYAHTLCHPKNVLTVTAAAVVLPILYPLPNTTALLLRRG